MQDIYVKDFKGTSDTTAQITVVNVSSSAKLVRPILWPDGSKDGNTFIKGTGTDPTAGTETVFTFSGLTKGTKYQVWIANRNYLNEPDPEATSPSYQGYVPTVTESGETLWVTFNGLAITPKLYGSVENKTKKVARLYGPVSSKATRLGKLYGSVEGKTRLVARFLLPPPLIEMLTYMQDCANYSLAELKEGMIVENPYTLIDKRDGNEYTIALLKDGNIWMCENLRLGGSSTMTLTGNDTDIPKNQSFTLPVSSTTGFGFVENINCYVDSTYGGYYTWLAATANTGKGLYTGEAYGSILPLGWRMPTGGSGSEFETLANTYGGSGSERVINLQKTPIPGFVLAGSLYSGSLHNQGFCGEYWSSTVNNINTAFYLYLISSGIYPTYVGAKGDGYSVRGICKGNGALA